MDAICSNIFFGSFERRDVELVLYPVYDMMLCRRQAKLKKAAK